MKAFGMFVAAVAVLSFLAFGASSAEACDRCQVATVSGVCLQPAVVYDRVVGRFEVVERTVVAKSHFVRPIPCESPQALYGGEVVVCERCHLRQHLCRCVGKVVCVARATAGTIVDAGATTVRVVASVPLELGGLAHRTIDRFDAFLYR